MDITIKNLQTKIPIRLPRIRSVVRRTFRHLRINNAELSIVFVTPLRMRSINAQYLKHDYVTDVITFDLDEAAEIVICPAVAFKNARVYSHSVTTEIVLYVIHGLLHLAGYDDHTQKDRDVMRVKEKQLLDKIL